MKIGLVIASTEPETVWNAFRFGCFAQERRDEVRVFLLGPGVEAQHIGTETFAVADQMRRLADLGGRIYACGTCLKLRSESGSELCPLSTMADLHALVHESDRVLTF